MHDFHHVPTRHLLQRSQLAQTSRTAWCNMPSARCHLPGDMNRMEQQNCNPSSLCACRACPTSLTEVARGWPFSLSVNEKITSRAGMRMHIIRQDIVETSSF